MRLFIAPRRARRRNDGLDLAVGVAAPVVSGSNPVSLVFRSLFTDVAPLSPVVVGSTRRSLGQKWLPRTHPDKARALVFRAQGLSTSVTGTAWSKQVA